MRTLAEKFLNPIQEVIFLTLSVTNCCKQRQQEPRLHRNKQLSNPLSYTLLHSASLVWLACSRCPLQGIYTLNLSKRQVSWQLQVSKLTENTKNKFLTYKTWFLCFINSYRYICNNWVVSKPNHGEAANKCSCFSVHQPLHNALEKNSILSKQSPNCLTESIIQDTIHPLEYVHTTLQLLKETTEQNTRWSTLRQLANLQ